MTQKSKFLTFVLSFFVSGLGHLYLGLNRRGLQFMAVFFACIVLIPLMPMVFPFILAIVYFYALFDALQKATLVNAYMSEGKVSGADSVDNPAEPDFSNLDSTLLPAGKVPGKTAFSPVWVGGVLILIGILLLLRLVFPGIWTLFLNVHVGSILLAAALIGFGVWLIWTQSGKGE